MNLEDPLEEEMATQSSVLARGIPWTEEPGGPQFLGHKRIGHALATKQQQRLNQCVKWLENLYRFKNYEESQATSSKKLIKTFCYIGNTEHFHV